MRLLICAAVAAAMAAAMAATAACATFSAAPGATPAEQVYNREGRCIVCHGKNGGGADGPNLLERSLTRAGIDAAIRTGPEAMPSAAERGLTDEQIALATDWVAELRRKAGKDTPRE